MMKSEEIKHTSVEMKLLREKLKLRTASPEEKLRYQEMKLSLMSLKVGKTRAVLEEKRKRSTARKEIILGRFVLDSIKEDPNLAAYMQDNLSGRLNASDRTAVAEVLEYLNNLERN